MPTVTEATAATAAIAIAATAFDSGPLSSIRAEIGHSLIEARVALDKVRVEPADAAALERALSQLHQVTGALSMVGLAAAARTSLELEKLVGSISAGLSTELAQKITVAKSAMDILTKYLDELIGGQPDRPLKLAKCYALLNTLRGAQDAADSDLFFPDLMLPTPAPDPADLPPPNTIFVDAIRQARAIFQWGLLKLLREKDLVNGVREMRRAAALIEALKASSPSRSFWFAAMGFFDAVAIEPSSAGALAVQLFGKIDQQIKLLIDGPRDAPEQLFRDVLYVVGKSGARNEHIRQVRDIYNLDDLLWLPEITADNNARTTELINTLRDQVRAQKETFLALTNGNRAALEPFTKQAESIALNGAQLSNRDLVQLLQILSAVGRHLGKTDKLPSQTQALEIATAMLFVESSLEDYFRLTAEFAQQAATICKLLRTAMTGADLQVPEKPASQFADTMTLRAQTHLLIFQVGREVQINLTTIEGVLDDYFRDTTKGLTLTLIEPLLKQVHGALAMLDLDEAASLSELLSTHVIALAKAVAATPAADRSTINVAETAEAIVAVEGLTALGLYVSALQQGSANPRTLLLPTLIRFGLAEQPLAVQKTRPKRATEKNTLAVPRTQTKKPDVDTTPAATVAITAVASPVTNTNTGAMTTTDSAKAQHELQRLTASEAELKKIIQDRNKRINALELVVASLTEKIKNSRLIKS